MSASWVSMIGTIVYHWEGWTTDCTNILVWLCHRFNHVVNIKKNSKNKSTFNTGFYSGKLWIQVMKKQNIYGSPEHGRNRIYIISFEPISKRQASNSFRELCVIRCDWRILAENKRENCAGLSESVRRNYADVYILDILDSGGKADQMSIHMWTALKSEATMWIILKFVATSSEWKLKAPKVKQTNLSGCIPQQINLFFKIRSSAKSLLYGRRCVLKIFGVIGRAQHEGLVQNKLIISSILYLLDISLNGTAIHWNHWPMNGAQFKDPVCHMCLSGAVVAYFVTEFSEFRENI